MVQRKTILEAEADKLKTAAKAATGGGLSLDDVSRGEGDVSRGEGQDAPVTDSIHQSSIRHDRSLILQENYGIRLSCPGKVVGGTGDAIETHHRKSLYLTRPGNFGWRGKSTGLLGLGEALNRGPSLYRQEYGPSLRL